MYVNDTATQFSSTFKPLLVNEYQGWQINSLKRYMVPGLEQSVSVIVLGEVLLIECCAKIT